MAKLPGDMVRPRHRTHQQFGVGEVFDVGPRDHLAHFNRLTKQVFRSGHEQILLNVRGLVQLGRQTCAYSRVYAALGQVVQQQHPPFACIAAKAPRGTLLDSSRPELVRKAAKPKYEQQAISFF